MDSSETTKHEMKAWEPLSDKQPTYADFAVSGCLDSQSAWKEFGGKSLDQALAHFVDNPFQRQEAFMWMGPRAFLFYFPVIERYLYEAQAQDEYDDCEATILAQDSLMQLRDPLVRKHRALHARLSSLADYVLDHVPQYALTSKDRGRIAEAWEQVRATVAELRSKHAPSHS